MTHIHLSAVMILKENDLPDDIIQSLGEVSLIWWGVINGL